MPRPQFSLKTMLWLTLMVAAFCGGMVVQRQLDKPVLVNRKPAGRGPGAYTANGWRDTIRLRDGTEWERWNFDEADANRPNEGE